MRVCWPGNHWQGLIWYMMMYNTTDSASVAMRQTIRTWLSETWNVFLAFSFFFYLFFLVHERIDGRLDEPTDGRTDLLVIKRKCRVCLSLVFFFLVLSCLVFYFLGFFPLGLFPCPVAVDVVADDWSCYLSFFIIIHVRLGFHTLTIPLFIAAAGHRKSFRLCRLGLIMSVAVAVAFAFCL